MSKYTKKYRSGNKGHDNNKIITFSKIRKSIQESIKVGIKVTMTIVIFSKNKKKSND